MATKKSCHGREITWRNFEKVAVVLGWFFRCLRGCPGTSQKLPFSENLQLQRILGHLLRSLFQNPRNLSEGAPEVSLAVHTALLCKKHSNEHVMAPYDISQQFATLHDTFQHVLHFADLVTKQHKPS